MSGISEWHSSPTSEKEPCLWQWKGKSRTKWAEGSAHLSDSPYWGTGAEVSERSVYTKLKAVTNTPTVMPLHLLSETADSTKQLVIQKFSTTTLHLSMDSTAGNGHPLSYANFTPVYQVIHKQCWSILYAPHCNPCCLEKWNQYKCWLVTWCRFVSTPISPSIRHVPWLNHTINQQPQHTPLATEMGELRLHRIGRHIEHDVTYCYST